MNSSSRLSTTKIAPGALLSLSPEPETQKTGPHVPRILIADDNIVILKALSIKLKSKGYEVRTAMDGSTAVSCVRRERPDLIILDINFPPDVVGLGWDGFKVIAWLRRVDEARGTPLIVISGGDATKLKTRAIEEGAIAYFQKPVKNDELLATIKQAIATSAKPAQDSAK